MQKSIVALILAACVAAPLAALAQPAPGSGSMDGPPPEMRAKMESMHAQAKTDAYAALAPDHRTKVQAIVAQVTAGSLQRRAAVAQIDALLTPDERQSVAGVEQKTIAAMHAAYAGPNGGMPNGGPGAGAAPPNAGPNGAAPPSLGGRHRRTPGGFLLRVSMTPEQMHALRMQQQPPHAAATP